MIQGLWQSAAGLRSQQLRQDVLANNMANVETPGFKVDRVAFIERPVATESSDFVPGDDLRTTHAVLDALTGGLTYAPTNTDFSGAALVPTLNELDFAIDGDGFLAVRTPDGTRYTRNGRMTLREDGTIVTAANGFELLDRTGRPIRVDTRSSDKLSLDEAGRLRQGTNLVAELAPVDFEDRGALRKTGHNVYDGGGERPVPARSRMRQFAYEASGADPTATLVQMIEATRAYQLNATMISLQDSTLARAVNDIGAIRR